MKVIALNENSKASVTKRAFALFTDLMYLSCTVRSPYDTGSVPAPTIRPTLTEYDSLDRVIRTELPDGSVQTTEYGVTASGEPYTRTIDPLGNISIQRTDPAGNIVFVERLDSGETSLTSATYTYNAIGEMLKATDVKGNDIKATYDMLGRKLTLSSVDGGRREYTYDAYRLIEENSPNMRSHGQFIAYSYDGLSRLIKVDYPEITDTVYTYGTSGASDNAAGKITQMTDASGTITYKYGKLGETTEETRTLSVKNGTTGEKMTATMGYQSNYLGQMERVTYPDGETVDYGYDAGGQVKSVTGHHYTHDYLFVVDIGYDEFGQRIYIKYGNGVKTDYSYDENRRWLSSIETGMDGHQYQNIQYSFDAVGNVLGYSNDCMNGLRYSTSQNYTYDSLYQLTSAHGDTYYDPYPGGLPDVKTAYDQNFEFDVLGNMTCKLSKEKADYKKHVTGDDLNYTLNYSYAQGFAHRLDHVSDIYYKYDLNGNITMMHKGPILDYDSSNSGETPSDPSSDDDFWDDDWENGGTGGLIPGNGSGQSGNVGEQGASGSDDDFWDDDWENGGTSGLIPGNPDSGTGNNDDDFWDDDWENGGTSGLISGMKVVQFATESSSDDNFWDDWNENSESSSSWNGNTGSSSNSSGSAEASDDDFWDDDWENGGTSGHSDFGWGLGGGSGNKNPDSAIAGEYRWDERDRLIESFVGDKNASYVYGEDGQRSNKWTIYEETLYFNRMWTWHDGNANNDQTAKHIYLGSERIVSQMNSWKGQQTYSEEHHKTYYYHSDHLGSAQLITDYKGNEYQRIEYTPYGEEWIDKFQNENYVDMPYKFTGKERDEETGFYYYGARYLDPKFSIWMSTDPALGDYLPSAPTSDDARKRNQNLPGMGGLFNTTNSHLYNYAGNNPVKYIDPDGREWKLSSENIDDLNLGLKNLQENLEYLIKEVDKGIRNPSYSINDSLCLNANNCLGFDLTKNKDRKLFYNDLLKLREVLNDIDISKILPFEQNKNAWGAFVSKGDLNHNIYLTPLSLLVFSGISNTSIESLLFHEISHFNDSLRTIDDYELKSDYLIITNIPASERREYAQSWQLFYEYIFGDKK